MQGDVQSALRFIAARLSPDAIPVETLEKVLRQRYTALSAWPLDAQLGLYVLGWALGPGFSRADFTASVNRLVPDFAAAARTIGPGKTPTVLAVGSIVRQAFRNAAVVVRWNLDPEILYWPVELSDCAGSDTL